MASKCININKRNSSYDFYNWCNYYDYDFLWYIKNFLPFIKDEWKYISEGDIKDLVHEIDLAIKDIKPYLTVDDFDDTRDIIEFVVEKYTRMDLLKIILEHGDKELINKLINNFE